MYSAKQVLAFDFGGREVWRFNVGKESGNRHWGSGSSLVLVKDKVIVNASEESGKAFVRWIRRRAKKFGRPSPRRLN